MPIDGVVNIRGKDYNTVAKRVTDFRRVYPIADGWAIITELIDINADSVVMSATVARPDGEPVAMGHAEEERAASKINKTSALENCETSAIGRALAAAGFGGGEYASANEVVAAIAAQERKATAAKKWTDKQQGAFCANLGELGFEYESVAEWCESLGRPRPSVMPKAQREKLLDMLQDPKKSGAYVQWCERG